MSDFDSHCGECGGVTMCAMHGKWWADCYRDPKRGCREVCGRDASHDATKDD